MECFCIKGDDINKTRLLGVGIIIRKCDLNRAESVVEFESCVLDVDAVEEGSEIFVLDDSGLLDPRADLGNVLEVDALDGEIVLLLLLLGDQHSLGSIDALVHLETQEVLDFHSLNRIRVTLPFSMTFTTIGK